MEIPQEYLSKFKVSKRKDHEFQIIGKTISDFVGEPAYWIFTKYDHGKIKQAFLIAEKRNIRNLKYLIGVIKKL